MGKHKRSAVGALRHLLDRGCQVAAVLAPLDTGSALDEQRLDLLAAEHGLPMVSGDAELYEAIDDPASARIDLRDTDLVLSFLYWRLIRRPLIDLGRLGCVNFHPAPLPDFRGVGGYNLAVLEGLTEWGVAAHFVDERFDTGGIVRVDRFPIDRATVTALSLDILSQQHLLALFRDVIDGVLDGEELPRVPQGAGRYVTGEQFEELRRVRPDDPPELTERRIRAFWYPPYDGATLDVGGRDVTLVDGALLEQTAAAYRRAGIVP